MTDCTFICAFDGQSGGAPSPSARGMKTSAESLLITISNVQRVRQTRGERENKRGVRKREGESELSCAQARIAKLNEHEICTVSVGHRGRQRGVRVRRITRAPARPPYGTCVRARRREGSGFACAGHVNV